MDSDTFIRQTAKQLTEMNIPYQFGNNNDISLENIIASVDSAVVSSGVQVSDLGNIMNGQYYLRHKSSGKISAVIKAGELDGNYVVTLAR